MKWQLHREHSIFFYGLTSKCDELKIVWIDPIKSARIENTCIRNWVGVHSKNFVTFFPHTSDTHFKRIVFAFVIWMLCKWQTFFFNLKRKHQSYHHFLRNHFTLKIIREFLRCVFFSLAFQKLLSGITRNSWNFRRA